MRLPPQGHPRHANPCGDHLFGDSDRNGIVLANQHKTVSKPLVGWNLKIGGRRLAQENALGEINDCAVAGAEEAPWPVGADPDHRTRGERLRR